MNFNTFTEADEIAARDKFRNYGRGINMGRFSHDPSGATAAKWEDLIDPQRYSMHELKSKALEIASRIATACNDVVFGDNSIAFSHTTERDEKVDFTFSEMYLLLRSAYRYRQSTEEYKRNKAEAEALIKEIQANKSKAEKLKENKARLKKLQEQLASS